MRIRSYREEFPKRDGFYIGASGKKIANIDMFMRSELREYLTGEQFEETSRRITLVPPSWGKEGFYDTLLKYGDYEEEDLGYCHFADFKANLVKIVRGESPDWSLCKVDLFANGNIDFSYYYRDTKDYHMFSLWNYPGYIEFGLLFPPNSLGFCSGYRVRKYENTGKTPHSTSTIFDVYEDLGYVYRYLSFKPDKDSGKIYIDVKEVCGL